MVCATIGPMSWLIRHRWLVVPAVVIVALVIVAAVIAAALPDPSGGHASTDSQRRRAAGASPVVPDFGDSADDVAEGPVYTTFDPEAVRLAVDFVREWGHVGEHETAKQWRQRVAPYLDKNSVKELKTVDLTRVPNIRVNGKPRVEGFSPSAVTSIVPTTGGDIVVVCINAGDGWKVSLYNLA